MRRAPVIAVALLVVAGCGSSARVTTALPRIVSLSPAATELLDAIGAGDQIVDGNNAGHVELVVVSGNAPVEAGGTGGTGGTGGKARVLRLPAPKSLDDTFAELQQLGDASGHAKEAAAAVTRIRDGLAAVFRAVRDKANGLTFYDEIDSAGTSATSHTFVGQLYGMLGMVNVADAAPTGGSNPRLSAEFVLAARPSFIFLAAPQRALMFAAVPQRHVVALPADLASPSGLHAVEFLQAVASAVSG